MNDDISVAIICAYYDLYSYDMYSQDLFNDVVAFPLWLSYCIYITLLWYYTQILCSHTVFHYTHIITYIWTTSHHRRIPKKLASREDFQREMEALLRIQKWGGHPHICALHEHFDEGGYYYLILDLVEGGEMVSFFVWFCWFLLSYCWTRIHWLFIDLGTHYIHSLIT